MHAHKHRQARAHAHMRMHKHMHAFTYPKHWLHPVLKSALAAHTDIRASVVRWGCCVVFVNTLHFRILKTNYCRPVLLHEIQLSSVKTQ